MTVPKVFQSGSVTMAVGDGGHRVWAGQVELDLVVGTRVETDAETGKRAVSLRFAKAGGPEEAMRLEEQVRVAKSLGWLVLED